MLRHPAHAKMVVSALRFFDGQRLWLGDYAIMPNHVHVLLQPAKGQDLSKVLYSIKRFSARKIGDSIRDTESAHSIAGLLSRGRFWQSESYERIVRDEKELSAFRHYIARNPNEAKLRPGEFLYSTADWLDETVERPSHSIPT